VLAPLPFVLPLLRSGKLVPVLPQHVSQKAHAFFHYPNRKNLPARVRKFVDFMLHQLRRNPDLVSDPAELLAPFLRKTRAKR
jgi:DNA-binding transcriptional LysR family regulator